MPMRPARGASPHTHDDKEGARMSQLAVTDRPDDGVGGTRGAVIASPMGVR